jgi:hypothetical protein
MNTNAKRGKHLHFFNMPHAVAGDPRPPAARRSSPAQLLSPLQLHVLQYNHFARVERANTSGDQAEQEKEHRAKRKGNNQKAAACPQQTSAECGECGWNTLLILIFHNASATKAGFGKKRECANQHRVLQGPIDEDRKASTPLDAPVRPSDDLA